MSTATATTTMSDPYEAALNPQTQTGDKTFFGEVVQVDCWFCVLQKGSPKRVWDATHDSVDQRRTAIKISIQPLRGQYTIDQDTVDFAKDWTAHTLPSIRQLGLSLRDLKGKCVKLTRKPTGEQYTNKAGETKDRTAIVFLEIYPDRTACQAAADAFFAERGSGNGNNSTQTQATATPGQADTSAQERQFAAQSLPLLWDASGKNVQAFLGMLKANPMISKFFDAGSPEVRAFTGDAF